MSVGASVFVPPEPTPRILVVDDDHRVVELLTVALSGRGFQVITASDGKKRSARRSRIIRI
jgi:DNA-binding response OmpR family regulator